MLNPVALSIIANVFQDPKDRARAIGVWGAVFGVALALGPLLGGALTQLYGWRYIFLINLPIGIAAIALTVLFVPESKAAKPRAIDIVGQSLVIIMLGCLTYAVIEGQHFGWHSPLTIGIFTVSALSLAAILFYEPRRAEPLLDIRFFRSIPFFGATIIAIAAFGCFAGFLFLNALYLQQVRHFSAVQTGFCTLPLALMAMLCGPLSGRLVGSHGTRPSRVVAGVAMALSTLALTRLSDGTPVLLLLFTYITFGIGIGMVNPAISTVAVAGMPRSQAGVAAAIASTTRQVGASLGVAVAGTIVASSRASGLDFAVATHSIWWVMVFCGSAIALLGIATNTKWALRTSGKVAFLVQSANE